MLALVLLTLSAITPSVSYPFWIPLKILVGFPTQVVVTLKDSSLSVLLMDAIPRSMKLGFRMKTALLLKFIPHRELTPTLNTGANLQPTTLLKMSLGPLSSTKGPLVEVLSLSAFLIH